MTEKEKEKIIEALTLIRKTCEDAEDCDCCVLRTDRINCGVQAELPRDWEIVRNGTWKAFVD